MGVPREISWFIKVVGRIVYWYWQKSLQFRNIFWVSYMIEQTLSQSHWILYIISEVTEIHNKLLCESGFSISFLVGGKSLRVGTDHSHGKNLRQRCQGREASRGVQRHALWKILKSGPLRMHFQHSGEKNRVFEQNTDIIINFGFFVQQQHMNNFLYSFISSCQ